MATRKIVKVDDGRCNRRSLYIPNCAKGALQIVDGTAKLICDRFCDGLGDCLGHCRMLLLSSKGGAIVNLKNTREVWYRDGGGRIKEMPNA
jgi:MinD superfamily P-loop ATPase